MPSPRSFRGTVASRGYAEGPLFPLAGNDVTYAASGSPEIEAERLRVALATAASQLAQLVNASSGDAAEILEFQLAMLEDEALSAPAFVSIGEGRDAARAWRLTLQEQGQTYLGSDNEYFRARAADIRDIEQRVRGALTGTDEGTAPQGVVLLADDITPSAFLGRDWSAGGGIVLRRGSAASHVAMLARARAVPMLVGVAGAMGEPGEPALIDAETGTIMLSPGVSQLADYRVAIAQAAAANASADAMADKPAMTMDGTSIAVHLNIASPDDLAGLDPQRCDGIGLMRTEFLYAQGLPDEETQTRAYQRVLEWAGSKPVVIRTVDAGGDKPVPGFTEDESNPFLGLRGIRLALAKPEIFRVQIRALLRAAKKGNLKVMFPLIGTAAEFAAARALFVEESTKVGTPVPSLGIMVEVPAVAIVPETLREAAFFSIGSNDLTQYVMAAGRDNGAVALLNDVTHPALLSLITNVARYGRSASIPVSLCGDAGGDPKTIPALLQTGLRSLSVAPAQLAVAKQAIAGVRLEA